MDLLSIERDEYTAFQAKLFRRAIVSVTSFE